MAATQQSPRIGFIGIGKLGMPCAEVFAERFDVTG